MTLKTFTSLLSTPLGNNFSIIPYRTFQSVFFEMSLVSSQDFQNLQDSVSSIPRQHEMNPRMYFHLLQLVDQIYKT